LDPLEGCMLCTRNWIWSQSGIDDKVQLVTSNFDITRVIENANEFKSQRLEDQLSTALKTEEHQGHTRAVSSITSWKKGFVKDICMYKKCGRLDIDAKPTNNEEQFANKFYNFMRKHPDIIICEVSIPQINLDIGTALPQAVPASLLISKSTMWMTSMNPPLADAIVMEVKGRALRTIKVADAIVMAPHIMHSWPVLLECAVVEVTTIREGRDFEDLEYPDEEEGIEKLKDAKGNSILWPRKDIILKTHSSPFVSL
jgi:hypothetical protein